MASDRDISPCCIFCGNTSMRLVYTDLYHPLKVDHGPFDFYECMDCHSSMTYPMPSSASLATLYQSYCNGLPAATRDLQGVNEGELWHARCVERIRSLSGRLASQRFSWVDVGAGGGEMAQRMATAFPNSVGWAVDLHQRPAGLPPNIQWQQVDLNSSDFYTLLPGKFDVVFSTAVWEHVVNPFNFSRNLVRVVDDCGLLYIICPNYASLARKLLGRRWPYFTPGEHLAMPSPQGARACLQRSLQSIQVKGAKVRSQPIALTYSLFYTAHRFRLPFASIIPKQVRVSMPVGALETSLILNANA